MDFATVMHGVGGWSVDERLRLIEAVWDSLSDASGEEVLSDAHLQDLRRRLDNTASDPKADAPWEEVEARLRGNSR